jgi:O-antigen/teichoic acid export membrane protein
MFGTVATHSLIIVAVSLLLTTTFGLIFLRLTEADAGQQLALSVLMLAVLARGAVGWVRGCFVALERATWIPRYEVAFRGVEALVGIVMLRAGAGVVTICVLHVLSWLAEAAVSWRLLRSATRFTARGPVQRRLLTRYSGASAALMASPWLLLVFPQAAVIGLRQVQPDMALVAHLGIAIQFVTTFFIVPVALAQAILPGVARSARTRNESDTLVVVTALKVSLVFGALLASVGVWIGPALVVALFGERYALAGETLAWLMWALGPYSAAFISVAVLNGIGSRRTAVAGAGAIVVVLVAAFLWLHADGSADSLRATVVAFLLASVVGMFWTFRALSEALALESRSWWFGSSCILFGCAAFGLSGVVSPVFAAVAGTILAVAGTWGFGVLSGSELSVALSRSGLRVPDMLCCQRADDEPRS